MDTVARTNAGDADRREEPRLTLPREALTAPLFDLERYAGWLAKDHVSVAVRADVHALVAAVNAGNDPALLLPALDRNIARLPSGDIRKMLRKALAQIRAVLEPGTDRHDGERS